MVCYITKLISVLPFHYPRLIIIKCSDEMPTSLAAGLLMRTFWQRANLGPNFVRLDLPEFGTGWLQRDSRRVNASSLSH